MEQAALAGNMFVEDQQQQQQQQQDQQKKQEQQQPEKDPVLAVLQETLAELKMQSGMMKQMVLQQQELQQQQQQQHHQLILAVQQEQQQQQQGPEQQQQHLAGYQQQQQQMPAWLTQQMEEWWAHEERGTAPGQPALTLAGFRTWIEWVSQKDLVKEGVALLAGMLMKLRQVEHSMHFLEWRSESGWGLESELARYFWRKQTELAAAKASADLAGMGLAKSDWAQYRINAIGLAWRGGLVNGLWRSVQLRMPWWQI